MGSRKKSSGATPSEATSREFPLRRRRSELQPPQRAIPARSSVRRRALSETLRCFDLRHESCMGFDVGFGPPYRLAAGRMHEPASSVRPILDWLTRRVLLSVGSPRPRRRILARAPQGLYGRGVSRNRLLRCVESEALRRERSPGARDAPRRARRVRSGLHRCPVRWGAASQTPERCNSKHRGPEHRCHAACWRAARNGRAASHHLFSPYSSVNPNDKECA